jgi:two-component system, OmpR family, alkaline phosphatase synthesis response regulator PhoP
MAGELILIVDDETNIVQLIRMYLEREGYRTETASSGIDALDKVRASQPALMLLDIMLPGLDGLEVCRRLRAEHNSTPILMLTARDEDIDKVLGLELGADDYLTKPFNPHEMVARVRAIIRRSQRSQLSEETLQIGDLTINPARREVRVGDNLIDLRHQEFNLLLVLAEHNGFVLNRERLLRLAWGYDFYGHSRTVDVHIGSLRRKISSSSVRIETITGDGYKLTT